MSQPFAPGELQTRVLRELSACEEATTAELATRLGIVSERVSYAAAKLVRRGYIHRNAPGKYVVAEAGREAVLDDVKIVAGPIDLDAAVRRQPSNFFRDRLWKSMRIRRQFTLYELVFDAHAGEKDPVNDASRYVRALKGARYVTELAGWVPGAMAPHARHKRFQLIRDTGPLAPLHRVKLAILHDFNTGEDVPCTS